MMKTKLFVLALMLLIGGVVVGSCSKNDDDKDQPNNLVLNSFNEMFPGASQVSWDMDDGYYVADFYNAQFNAEAWFNTAGSWLLTETELSLDALPAAVMDNFNKSIYYNWEIDEVSKIERAGIKEPTYTIEVQLGDTEMKLVYNMAGELISEINDSDNTNTGTPPVVIPEAVQSYINANYSGATILYFDNERNIFEVDILHQGNQIELLFDNKTYLWIESNREVILSETPLAVQNAFKESIYANKPIEEIEEITRASGVIYEFELKDGKHDIMVVFNSAGVIVAK